jgi:protein-S-isoprenylcysteine O-methyltransferase Ste14
MTTILLVAFCWILFGGLHSALIHVPISSRLKQLFAMDDQTYRLFYAFFSVVSFFLAVLIMLISDGNWLRQPDWVTYSGGAVLIFGSLYLLRISFRNYSLTIFLGLAPDKTEKLNLGGMNRYVRHPLYLSTILLLVGFMVFWPSDIFVISCLVLISYTIIGARLEERKLINQFGKDYIDYMKEVPGFIPRWGE